jgi:uncharacterized protein YuzE
MQVEYDEAANAVYIRLNEKPYAYGEDLDLERRIDYAQDGSPIGVEFTCVDEGGGPKGRAPPEGDWPGAQEAKYPGLRLSVLLR